MKTNISNNVKRILNAIIGEIAMWWLWIKNLFFIFLTTKSKARVFKGYGHWWFAKKYADRRYKMSRVNKYCGGKRHYVLPVGEYSLAVFNSLELQMLRKRKIIKSTYTINEVRPASRVGETSAGGWNSQAVYTPRRSKFKGYMRDNRNWGRK
jgi:hypothetical protein